ncbi:TadE/TadG family type IV pilus assembly protein [Alteraurantiacibacter buctensis]|uniref:Pilus assembly protein n=1 Tax=Alteraurantiacibacter buctensis TaxID=1503981 RepID=A0A844Z1C6_9SPHN|nr:TadE/TadG family type IV pilus assembly protein [Alteraurantiacibacter buctensis]MXO72237.1 pilus assembly protein [Alteraurantiacibacter buctensis]
MARIRLYRRIVALRADTGGAAVVEFALIAPVLIMALMGMFDLTYNIYTSAMLEGSIQKAARDSSVEDADAVVDNRVTSAVKSIAPDATLTFSRRAYDTYANVAQPEDFTDLDNNGACNAGEPFEDVNGNNTWDRDRGSSGFGGARDAVMYEVTVSYPRPFPISRFVPGMDARVTTVARTILRNQPFGMQQTSVRVGNCT